MKRRLKKAFSGLLIVAFVTCLQAGGLLDRAGIPGIVCAVRVDSSADICCETRGRISNEFPEEEYTLTHLDSSKDTIGVRWDYENSILYIGGNGVIDMHNACYLNVYSMNTIYIEEGITGVKEGGSFNFQGTKIIHLPDTFEKITNEDGFRGPCRNLDYSLSVFDEINIPSGVKSIGSDAFSNSYKSFTVNKNAKVIGGFRTNRYITSLEIPDSIKIVDQYGFGQCRNLKRIVFGSGLEEIKDGAFSETPITQLNFQEGLQSIGNDAFNGCSDLEQISFPASLKRIGAYAFVRCPKLSGIYIPDSVKEIGEHAFGFYDENAALQSNRSSLKNQSQVKADSQKTYKKIKNYVICGEKNSAAHKYAKKYGFKFVSDQNYGKTFVKNNLKYKIDDSGDVRCYGVKAKKASITIPDRIKMYNKYYKVTYISANAFKNNNKLKKVKIGNNITGIGSKAFYRCVNLKTLTIGKNVKTIGANSFNGCKNLTKISIPMRVNSIGTKAFYNCRRIRQISFKTKKLTSKKVGKNAFKGVKIKAKIKVPKGKLNTYMKWLVRKGINKKAIIY